MTERTEPGTPTSQIGYDESSHKKDSTSDAASSTNLEAPPAAVYTGPRKWYRSTFFNITVLGICSFLAPGLWGAMNSLGAGGSQNPHIVNAANSLTFVLMVVSCIFNSALVNRITIKYALAFGTVGYSIYAASLYCNSAFGNQWFVLIGAACCGISAGSFWASEGAIALAYPERSKQGKYLSYWLMFRVLGQCLGGAINLGLNAKKDTQGSISNQTYLVFVALQCTAPFIACLLSQPHQVQRKDGSPVYLAISSTLNRELKQMWKLVTRPQVLLLLPLIWQGTFSEALTSTYNVTYFTVRSRALGSFLSAIVASIANYILGYLLDMHRFTLNGRARCVFVGVFVVLQGAYWVWAVVYMNHLHNMPVKPVFDWNSPGFGKAFALYIFLQVGFNNLYESNYWLLGGINDDSSQIIRLAAILRGVESAGQSVSYGINSTSWRLDAVAGLNMGFWFVSLVPAWLVVRNIGILPDGTRIHEPQIYAPPSERERLVIAGVAVAAPDGRGEQLAKKIKRDDPAAKKEYFIATGQQVDKAV